MKTIEQYKNELELNQHQVALLMHLEEVEGETITQELAEEVEAWDESEYYDHGQYELRVLTDEEADDAWEESLDNYIEECIYPEMPDHLQNYFDETKWKQDAKYDGRGHSLSSYDGCEFEQQVDGEWFMVYRV